MTGNDTTTDPRSPGSVAAAETQRRTRALRLTADSAVTASNSVWPRQAFNGGIPAPGNQDEQFLHLQTLGVEQALEWIREYTLPYGVDATKWRQRIAASGHVLHWLLQFPGRSWDERWLQSGMDQAPREGLEDVLRKAVEHQRDSATFLDVAEPLEAARLRALPEYRRAHELIRRNAENAIARILVRTGKRLGKLTGDDVLAYSHIARQSRRHAKEHLAWELLVALGPLAGEPPTLRAAWHASMSSRRHTVKTLVGRYGIPESGVRDLLIDYLEQLKPNMDYGSLEGIAYRLVRLFCAEVIDIHPDQKDLRLPPAVAAQWRERIQLTLEGRTRREISSTYFAVRALYRDIAEWSHEEPERWAIWVAPIPLPRAESKAASKERRQVQARRQQRTRSLTPLLPAFMRSATALREQGARLLEQTLCAAHDETYIVDGVTYRRHDPPIRAIANTRARIWAEVMAAEKGTSPPVSVGKRADITGVEADGFWGWAVVSTLKETGIRVEELQELTQLSLRHYVAPTTNTIVPLLHIVPSKTDQERLIPMSPELVKILVEIQRRARGTGQTVPLSIRYDPYEKTFGEPLPPLFGRLVGPSQNVLSHAYIRRVLNGIASNAGLTDAGSSITFTPHDFRRLFANRACRDGLAAAHRLHPPGLPESGNDQGIHCGLPRARNPGAPRLYRTPPSNPPRW
jgi:hypothetical protein